MARSRRLSRRGVGALTALALVLSTTLLSVVIAAPASAATDLALGRSASADSAQSANPAAAANDGNPATRWCAADGNVGHWWQVDLGGAADLTGTQVQWEFARNYRYQVSVSTDGRTWTTVVDQNGNTGSAQSQTDAFTARARYVRVTVTGLAAGTWASIRSFSVFGTGGPPAPEPFKGIAGPACADMPKLNAPWWYNWWISPGSCAAPGFVPTISGKSERDAGQVKWARDRVIEAGYPVVLGFNEPNKVDQANMTVEHAVSLWPTLTADDRVKVSSPATSGDGQAWFTAFMREAEAKRLRIDILAIHWYGWNAGSCDANAATFENYLRWAESFPGNKPIWVTEFGCMHQSNPNPAAVQAFYKAALKVFERHPRVQRHSWYPWLPNNELVGPTGALTPVGTAVAQAPAYR